MPYSPPSTRAVTPARSASSSSLPPRAAIPPRRFLALNQIAADLRRVQERLERTAEAAEVDQQRLAVASLSGQQLRAAEVRAKLGGVGGYASPRGVASDAPKFELNIIFSGGRTQRIGARPYIPTIRPLMRILPRHCGSKGRTLQIRAARLKARRPMTRQCWTGV